MTSGITERHLLSADSWDFPPMVNIKIVVSMYVFIN